MNQTFDPARFLRLLRAHWAESWKGYAWFCGVCAILNGIFLAIALQTGGNQQYSSMQQTGQVGWYTVGLLVTGLVFATRYFESFSGTGATLILLMRPASVFEKWCLALLFVCVLFPLVYTAVYVCMNYPAVAYAKSHYLLPSYKIAGEPVFHVYVPFSGLNPVSPEDDHETLFSLIELAVALKLFSCWAMCMAGRVFFKRAAVLKTWLFAFGLLILGYCVSERGSDGLFFADLNWALPLALRPATPVWDTVLAYAVLFGVPILLWLALFFHIKEREVS